MNVLGIGIDATDIPRVAEMLARYGDRFLRRVFTDGEIAYCTRHRNPAPHLAGRFAAKEAAMKALGTGARRRRAVAGRRGRARGRPAALVLHGAAAERAPRLKVARSLVTITHAEAIAIAQVMLVG